MYFYIWDRDFGPSYIKFCTYALVEELEPNYPAKTPTELAAV